MTEINRIPASIENQKEIIKDYDKAIAKNAGQSAEGAKKVNSGLASVWNGVTDVAEGAIDIAGSTVKGVADAAVYVGKSVINAPSIMVDAVGSVFSSDDNKKTAEAKDNAKADAFNKQGEAITNIASAAAENISDGKHCDNFTKKHNCKKHEDVKKDPAAEANPAPTPSPDENFLDNPANFKLPD